MGKSVHLASNAENSAQSVTPSPPSSTPLVGFVWSTVLMQFPRLVYQPQDLGIELTITFQVTGFSLWVIRASYTRCSSTHVMHSLTQRLVFRNLVLSPSQSCIMQHSRGVRKTFIGMTMVIFAIYLIVRITTFITEITQVMARLFLAVMFFSIRNSWWWNCQRDVHSVLVKVDTVMNPEMMNSSASTSEKVTENSHLCKVSSSEYVTFRNQWFVIGADSNN